MIWIKKRSNFTVYTRESVFEPRYRSENADAAIWKRGETELERQEHDICNTSIEEKYVESYTIKLEVCDGRDCCSTFKLGELLRAQKHRG